MKEEDLFDELDASLQVHTEIDEDPLDTFALVLFLLKNEHVMVEKLLQLLVGEVDTKLLETVELRFLIEIRKVKRNHRNKQTILDQITVDFWISNLIFFLLV